MGQNHLELVDKKAPENRKDNTKFGTKTLNLSEVIVTQELGHSSNEALFLGVSATCQMVLPLVYSRRLPPRACLSEGPDFPVESIRFASPTRSYGQSFSHRRESRFTKSTYPHVGQY
jgi:hypothetical protein